MVSPSFKYVPTQLKTFFWWINERHSIYLRRAANKDPPWTKDPIMQTYKFTNPFRQNDRVTQAWLDRYAGLLGGSTDDGGKNKDITDGDILFNCALFRLFNLPATYDALHYSGKWSYDRALTILEDRKAHKMQIFTGAYIIPNMGSSDPKIDIITGAVDLVYENRHEFAAYIRSWRSMEKTVEVLQLVPTIGPFIAYEIACDLRFTRVLSDALDVDCWANPGPGAKRGIHRLLYGVATRSGIKPDYVAVMRDLLVKAHRRGGVGKHVLACEWPFEMREIEHSLCEYDKFMRVKNGEGRPRSKFKPTPPPPWKETAQQEEKSTYRKKHEASVQKFLAKIRHQKKKESETCTPSSI